MGFGNRLKNLFGPDKETKNFKCLDDLIHSGVNNIILDSDIVLGGDEKSNFNKGIKLDVDDLVIDGNGHTIDAKGKTRIFYCTGKNIIIKNIILKNGFAKENGGAIYNYGGILSVSDSTFTENTAKENGGAIYNYGGILSVSDSTFTENTVKGILRHNYGGAIYNNSELTISDSTFSKNTANNDGGAIYNNSELTVSDSTFSKNIADRNGGAIYNSKIFKVFNCKFIDNNSENSIIFNSNLLQVNDCVFMGNHGKNVIFNESIFADMSIFKWSNIGIFNCEFKDNDISETVIFNNGKSFTIKKTIFKNNNANIIVNKSNLTLINPKIEDEGRTILNEKYILIKNSPSDFENKIYGEGIIENTDKFEFQQFDFGYFDKKIHESTTNEIKLENDISFENYEIDYYEGGIELDIDNLIIDGNGHTIDANGKTRIFYCTAKNITLKNITFKNGFSHKNYDNPFNNHGGAIKINKNTNLNIENCKFINNTSQGKAGAIHNNSELTVSESMFCGNNTAEEGGAIHNGENCVLTVSSSRFTGNNTSGDGGAIHNNSELTVSDSTFTENTGGAICNGENCVLTVSGSTFTGNKSYLSGAIRNGGVLTVSDSTFTGNTAIESGGAIGNGGVLTVSGSTFAGNISRKGLGGAIFNGDKCVLTVSGSTFTGNTAEKWGGAIIIGKYSKKYELNNCTFKDNKPDDVYNEKD